MICFEVPGEPQAWARAGVRVIAPRGGKPFASFYDTKEQLAYKRAIAMLAKSVLRSKPPLDCAVVLRVTALRSVPKSWPKRDRDAALSGVIRPTSVPDADNYTKVVKDALNKIAWNDDAQVVTELSAKFYAETPLLRIEFAPTGTPLEEAIRADVAAAL